MTLALQAPFRARESQIAATISPSVVKFGQHPAQVWPKLNTRGRNLDEIDRTRSNSAHHLDEVGPTSVEIDQTWPNSAEFGHHLAKHGREWLESGRKTSAKFGIQMVEPFCFGGHIWPTSVRKCSTLAQCSPKLVQCSAGFGLNFVNAGQGLGDPKQIWPTPLPMGNVPQRALRRASGKIIAAVRNTMQSICDGDPLALPPPSGHIEESSLRISGQFVVASSSLSGSSVGACFWASDGGARLHLPTIGGISPAHPKSTAPTK